MLTVSSFCTDEVVPKKAFVQIWLVTLKQAYASAEIMVFVYSVTVAVRNSVRGSVVQFIGCGSAKIVLEVVCEHQKNFLAGWLFAGVEVAR